MKFSLRAWVIFFALIAFASTAFAARVETVRIPTERGVEIVAKVHIPDGEGLKPGIVLAPGKMYHMDLPYIANLAEAAANAGFLVVRFNWHYFSNNLTAPTEYTAAGLTNEIDDMNSAVHYLVAHPQALVWNTTVAGKSLGSIVTQHVAQKNLATVKTVALLTPVCEENFSLYPGLDSADFSTVFVLGNRDAGCTLADLYRFASTMKRTPLISVLAGGHGFELGTAEAPAAPERDAENVAAAVSASLYWLKQRAGL